MCDLQVVTNDIFENISNHEETKGFDFCAGANWIYPLNYPIRDYQFNIVKNALFENTLVSLPTGLGKTFIAAVIMYNYFRWYPNGKIIFMAPTKPLVRQQIDACYNIVGIPKETTVELTGTIQQAIRTTLWREKRVFFITPHVLQNDLDNMPEIADNIKCLVLDEAHKAKGTYAYCEVMRKLQERNKYFRVLALSATPGGNVREILEVAKTLYISHLEVRTDESVDVAPYVYNRSLTTVNVPFDKKLYDVREEYLQIIEQYARILIQNKVFTGNYSQLSKGRIFLTLRDYQARKAKNVNIPNYNNIMKSLTICLTLYHGLELLTRHGLRGFLLYYEEHIQKPLLRGNQALHNIINDLKEYLGPLPDWRPLPDGNLPQLAKNVRFGHPKFRKLGDVLSSHFIENDDDSTRAIVFFEYKDSVIEAYALLLEYHPLVKAKVFMGQSSITQKQQKSTLNIFRTGECNTLLSTSIGEEGLDVGEVDLIVCFDISSKSPIRMVQRMGRTGRKREGKIVVLITEGKEEELLRECLIQKKTLNESILNSSELHTHLYQDNPKMVPEKLVPACKKIHITVRPVEEKPIANKSTKGTTKKSKNAQSNAIKTMFESISCTQGTCTVTYPEFEERLPQNVMLCLKDDPIETTKSDNEKYIDFSKYLEKHRSWQNTILIDHSQNSELLRSILQFADSKRFNIPQTQIERTKSAKTGTGLYQPDIRSMFLKQQQIPTSQLEVDVNLNEKVAEILLENKMYESSSDLHTEIRDYLTISYSSMFSCKMCDKYKHICNLFKSTTKEDNNFNVLSWTQPDNRIFDYLNKDTLNKFLRQTKGENNREETNSDEDEFISADVYDNTFLTQPSKEHNPNEDEFISAEFLNNIKFQEQKPNNNVDDKNDILDSANDNNNLMNSFKDDDFISMDLIEHFFLNNAPCKKVETEETAQEIVSIKVEPKSPSEKSQIENTILFDDEFISSEIFALNFSGKSDDNYSSKIETCKRNVSQKINKSPTKLFKFKNKCAENLSYSDFFAEDTLSGLSSRSFKIKNNELPTPEGSISETHKNTHLSEMSDKKNEDEICDFATILAELQKSPNNAEKTENETVLNSSASDCEEINSLNQGFYDQKPGKSGSDSAKSSNKSDVETNNYITKTQMDMLRNDCISPDLFCDSDSSIELDKEVSPTTSTKHLNITIKKSPNELLDDSQDGTILLSPTSSMEDLNLARKSQNSPRYNTTLNSDASNKNSPCKSMEKSPSLWNLSKIYTQTSREINGTTVKRKLSLSTDRFQSLSFKESMFNSLDFPDTEDDFKIDNEAAKPLEKKKAKVKRKLCLNSSFLDMEAALDGSQSADENETDLNEYDASFVNDCTQDVGNTTALHAFYLKTTRSPKKDAKRFKIPALPKMDKMNIFSQIEPTQNETYLEDSFCVDVLTQNITKDAEYDVLEEAEKILKNRKRRKKSTSQDDGKKKRRRMRVLSDSD